VSRQLGQDDSGLTLLTLWQVERFASRMAKYQDNEDKMTEDYSRAKIEAEKAKEKLERVTLVCTI
jgi:hypothetical protein